MENAALVGTSHSNSTTNPYQLSNQNSVMNREWDGYCWDILPFCKERKASGDALKALNPILQNQSQQNQNTINTTIAKGKDFGTTNARNQQLMPESKKMIDAHFEIQDIQDKASNGGYMVQRIFIPSWQDYARSSEKLAYDKLESDIAFTAICMTDTVFPYGCNTHHSNIARNYDLSVSPNVRGRDKYIQDNTRIWLEFDQAAYQRDLTNAQTKYSDALANINGIVSNHGLDLKNKRNSLLNILSLERVGLESALPSLLNNYQRASDYAFELNSQAINSFTLTLGGVGCLMIGLATAGVGGSACGAGLVGGVGYQNEITRQQRYDGEIDQGRAIGIGVRDAVIGAIVEITGYKAIKVVAPALSRALGRGAASQLDNLVPVLDDGVRCVACDDIPGVGGVTKGVKGTVPVINNVDDLVSNSTLGIVTKGKTTQYVRQGGHQQAISDFNNLNPSNIKTYDNGTIAGILPDGRSINVRSGSNSGQPTIEIIEINNKRTKFRYDN